VENRVGRAALWDGRSVSVACRRIHLAGDGQSDHHHGAVLFKSLPYEPSKFMPVTLMVQSDNFILAHPDVPAKNLRELVELVKREPKKWTYGSFGAGPSLSSSLST